MLEITYFGEILWLLITERRNIYPKLAMDYKYTYLYVFMRIPKVVLRTDQNYTLSQSSVYWLIIS